MLLSRERRRQLKLLSNVRFQLMLLRNGREAFNLHALLDCQLAQVQTVRGPSSQRYRLIRFLAFVVHEAPESGDNNIS